MLVLWPMGGWYLWYGLLVAGFFFFFFFSGFLVELKATMIVIVGVGW